MIENSGHMISRFTWNTFFDQKEKAYELQQRLSNWSRIKMPGEMTDVFNALCPPEQVWKIQTMELDLGVIEYDDLEYGLAKKLRDQLHEKLTDLIIYPDNNNNIEVLNEQVSQIYLVRYFLLHGLVVWSHKSSDQSINQILAQLLLEEHKMVIAMLREIGVTHENVRRRIGWQVSEPNIIKIIEGLEPSNHEQIINFSRELTRIQAKETIVQTSLMDFKRNLWFWILNYLFTERGTIFNKVAFMKSNIRQMAAYYSIPYDKLIEMIGRAVNAIEQHENIKADVILTLKLLVKEKVPSQKGFTKAGTHDVDLWDVLKSYFRDRPLREHESSKAEFNDLIISLSEQNSVKLCELFLSLRNDEAVVLSLISELNETSLEAIFSVLGTIQHSMVMQSIYFLDDLCKKTELNIELKYLLETGLKFLIDKKGATFNSGEFLEYIIDELSKRKQVSKVHMLEQLISAEISSTSRTLSAIAIYSDLTSIFASEISGNASAVTSLRFKKLLDMLSYQIVDVDMDKTLFIPLKRLAVRYMQFSPGAAFNVLTGYADKNNLKKLLPYILDNQLTGLLVRNAKRETSLILLSVRQAAMDLNLNNINSGLKASFEESLLDAGLHTIIFYPSLSGQKFLEFVIERLAVSVPYYQYEQFLSIVGQLPIIDKKAYPSDNTNVFTILLRQRLSDKQRHVAPGGVTGIEERILLAKQSAALNKHFDVNSGVKLSSKEIFSLIEQCITLGMETITSEGHEFHLNDLIEAGLESNALEFRRILSIMPVSEKRIRILNAAVPFNQFCLFIANDAPGEIYDAIISIKALHNLVVNIASGQIVDRLIYAFWRQLCHIIKTSTLNSTDLKKLVRDSLHQLALETQTDSAFIVSEIKKNNLQLTPALRNALFGYASGFSSLPVNEITAFGNSLDVVKQKGMLYHLSYDIITRQQIPAWLGYTGEQSVNDLLSEIITLYPVNLLLVLKRNVIPERQIAWLSKSVSFNTLIKSIGSLNRDQQAALNNLQKLYEVFGTIALSGISAKEMQYVIFKKLIKAWTTNNWRIISSENIWNELIWDVSINNDGSKKQFIYDIKKAKSYFPPSLQISLGNLKSQDGRLEKNNISILKPNKENRQSSEILIEMKDSIPVRNAGLVLVSSYIQLLLERLRLTDNSGFINEVAKSEAVHYLQYVVTGLSSTDEFLLPLNKVLCGLPLLQPLQHGIDVSEDHKKLIEGLITAIIGQWPSIGNSSVDGFRGNWLVREGILCELDDKWELTVEKRAYDVLLHTSPFSFSIIKYPWMSKPLHVNWPY